MCIKLHFHLIILMIYFYAIHKIKIFLCFYTFAILHELAHITVALIIKVKIKEITLLPVGVCANYDYIKSKINETLIAAAGPLFSIVVAVMANDEIVKEINYVIAFLNLLPVYPLDGGRILRCVLSITIGHKKSVKVSSIVAKLIVGLIGLLAIILFVYFKNFSLLLFSIYIYMIFREETKKDRILEMVRKLIEE